eukprot:3120676-Prymnesium_polylepis.1
MDRTHPHIAGPDPALQKRPSPCGAARNRGTPLRRSRARTPKRFEAQQLQPRFVAVEGDDYGQHMTAEAQVGGIVVPREDSLIYMDMGITSSLDREGNEVAQVQTCRRTCGSAWIRKCNPWVSVRSGVQPREDEQNGIFGISRIFAGIFGT